MIIPEIKYLHSPDVPSLENFVSLKGAPFWNIDSDSCRAEGKRRRRIF